MFYSLVTTAKLNPFPSPRCTQCEKCRRERWSQATKLSFDATTCQQTPQKAITELNNIWQTKTYGNNVFAAIVELRSVLYGCCRFDVLYHLLFTSKRSLSSNLDWYIYTDWVSPFEKYCVVVIHKIEHLKKDELNRIAVIMTYKLVITQIEELYWLLGKSFHVESRSTAKGQGKLVIFQYHRHTSMYILIMPFNTLAVLYRSVSTPYEIEGAMLSFSTLPSAERRSTFAVYRRINRSSALGSRPPPRPSPAQLTRTVAMCTHCRALRTSDTLLDTSAYTRTSHTFIDNDKGTLHKGLLRHNHCVESSLLHFRVFRKDK